MLNDLIAVRQSWTYMYMFYYNTKLTSIRQPFQHFNGSLYALNLEFRIYPKKKKCSNFKERILGGNWNIGLEPREDQGTSFFR